MTCLISFLVWFVLADTGLAANEDERMEVRGASQKKALEKSSRDVVVIETKESKTQAADTGEVLARTQGVSVRRSGGLGSEERFSLNGLSDDRIRFFLDGIPLSLAGYDFGLANVPLNFMKRIEIYRGVVPIQFGADALGGAINLVSDNRISGNRWSSSLMAGSFQTVRWTWAGQARSEKGWLVRGSGFNDYAGNNYKVTARVPDAEGRPQNRQVERFHDRYRARGYGIELGTTQQSWAEEFIVRAFHAENQKELQSNAVMSVPYGEALCAGESDVLSLRYNQALSDVLRLETTTGVARNKSSLRDLSLCIYDWYGHCKAVRQIPGEISNGPQDLEETYQTYFTRLNADWTVDEFQHVRTSLALTQGQRQGRDRTITDPDAFDRLSLQRELVTSVLGIEHELRLFDDRLENTLFAKAYQQELSTEKSPLVNASFQNERLTSRGGWGNSLGFAFTEEFYGKFSFEQAIRLPTAEEIFGDGAQVLSNMELIPETSRNINVGVNYEGPSQDYGRFEGGIGFFRRDTKDLILLVGSSDQAFIYANLYDATGEGVESNVSWRSPASNYQAQLNATYMDNRNEANRGPFGSFRGDRIPNQPYFFANSHVSARWSDILSGTLEATFNARYTAAYFRTWESLGRRDDSLRIPEALLQSIGLSLSQKTQTLSHSLSAEIQNLSDEKIFDVYGLQRPGRSYFLKSTLDL